MRRLIEKEVFVFENSLVPIPKTMSAKLGSYRYGRVKLKGQELNVSGGRNY